jgi:hypothetical protein
LRQLNAFRQEVYARATEAVSETKHRPLLEQLWRAFKKDEFVLQTKAWQDAGSPSLEGLRFDNGLQLGFQGMSPTTDFRSTGLLG